MRIGAVAIIGVACALVGCAGGSAARGGATGGARPASEPEGMPAGYVVVKVRAVGEVGDEDLVVLVDEASQRLIPIAIGGTEAVSIAMRMHAEQPPRPLTHDLLDAMLRRLGGSIVKVQVDALTDGVFIGSVFVRDATGHVFRLDSRASDAIALAVGNRVPVYVAKAVIDEAGIGRDELEQQRGSGKETYSALEPRDQSSSTPSASAWRKYFRVTFHTSQLPPEPVSTHGV